MQDAPEDLYAEALRQLLNPQRYAAEEIARREQLLEQTIVELRAPLHTNCYLSPTEFAERFGLPSPVGAASAAATAEQSAAPKLVQETAPEAVNPSQPESEERPLFKGSLADAGAARFDPVAVSAVSHDLAQRPHSWAIWLTVAWALTATAAALVSLLYS
jgi:hypothetical protein